MNMDKTVAIKKILDALSLEFVLAEKNDPESFSEILPLLKELFETAEKQNIPEIAEKAFQADKILKNFSDKPISDLTEKFDLLDMIISEMNSFIHRLPCSDIGLQEPIIKKERPGIPIESEILPNSRKEHPPVNNILHPDELPSCLNMDDFSEFLNAQKYNLEKMERLILNIEKDKDGNTIFRELKMLLHTMKGESGFLNLKNVERVCHKTEDLIETNKSQEIVDTLLAVKDWLQSTFEVYSGHSKHSKDINTIISLFDALDTKKIDMPCLTNASPENPTSTDKKPTSPFVTIKEYTNVDVSRLDRMMDTIGEFAIAESMVFQSPEIKGFASAELMHSINLLRKITRELRDIGLSLRMIPLKSLFDKMERVVWDLSKKTKKKIQLVIKGETTELDKNIVDKIKDPLIHLIRNSVDHGIEDNPNQRVQAGKTETATIELKAYHKGSNIFIKVTDDGRGIDKIKLFKKAAAKGLISDKDILSDKEIFNLIFHSGLSTADKVTDVSGRGVGMDVVKKSIQSCNGMVSIESTAGRSTTCTISIPLTLSMIDGLVVRVGKERYIVPTLSVVTSLKPDKDMLSSAFEKEEMLNALDSLLPIIRIHRLFDIQNATEDPCSAIVIVVEDNGRHAGLLVDELLGKQNTVIKKLGRGMEKIKGIAGGTIMPDGKVSLILDIATIIETTATLK